MESGSPDDLAAEDYQALAELRDQIRRFVHFSEQAARAAGLEPQQHQLLLAVKGQPEDEEASVGALAERLQLQPHSALELVERLVERGVGGSSDGAPRSTGAGCWCG